MVEIKDVTSSCLAVILLHQNWIQHLRTRQETTGQQETHSSRSISINEGQHVIYPILSCHITVWLFYIFLYLITSLSFLTFTTRQELYPISYLKGLTNIIYFNFYNLHHLSLTYYLLSHTYLSSVQSLYSSTISLVFRSLLYSLYLIFTGIPLLYSLYLILVLYYSL